MERRARSPRRPCATSMAGVSRVSPVSFLKANPKMAIFLPDTVLNMEETMRCEQASRKEVRERERKRKRKRCVHAEHGGGREGWKGEVQL